MGEDLWIDEQRGVVLDAQVCLSLLLDVRRTDPAISRRRHFMIVSKGQKRLSTSAETSSGFRSLPGRDVIAGNADRLLTAPA